MDIKADQSPQDVEKGIKKSIRRKYNITKICKVFGITEEQVFHSSKNIPKQWKENNCYSSVGSSNPDVLAIVAEARTSTSLRNQPREVIESTLQAAHKKLVALGASGTHSERLFIRYIRKYFMNG